MHLVIVESPGKAKTINKYLGSDFKVIASVGHVRSLPSKVGSVLPDKDFELKYDITDRGAVYMRDIIKASYDADTIYLATDPDREGESISWHIVELINAENVKKKPKSLKDFNFKRITFNEVTKKALLDAIKSPRNIDIDLVHAQQARQALDYLVGFTISPVLWRKLHGCKSAGRVQSVALRLICEREEEIEKFKSEEYWDIYLDLLNKENKEFNAKLTYVDGKKLEKFSIINEKQAKTLVQELQTKEFLVHQIEQKQQKRNPPAPFITSSLQQDAARKLGLSASKTMQIAQQLYEGVDIGKGDIVGLITYMRTDGVNLSADAMDSIRELITNKFGAKYLPSSPRVYKSKAKNAQEAHEAIRPTDISIMPEQLKNISKNHYKLYKLIWERSVACQMQNAIINIMSVDLNTHDNYFVARAIGSNIAFDGFYKVYKESVDDHAEEKQKLLPKLVQGDHVITKHIKPNQHFTEPPPKYSEATLIKKLEELGIGRPSTYAPILSVLQSRKYVLLDKKRFTPSETGRVLSAFLINFFGKYVQYDFTAHLESSLDDIAAGKLEWKDLLKNFWDDFDNSIKSIEDYKMLDVVRAIQENLSIYLFGIEQNKQSRKCTKCNQGELELRLSKFGVFLGCNNYPECEFHRSIRRDSTENAINIAEEQQRFLAKDEDGKDLYLKRGPYGWYIQVGENTSSKDKPKRASIPSFIPVENVNLSIAKKMLNLPMNLGKNPETNEDIFLGIGKFGPYLKYQGKFTAIPKDISSLSISLNDALQIIKKKNEKSSS